MEYRQLGRTGLQVSVACLGTGGRSRLGTVYGSSFKEAEAVVAAAVDGGVNFIDTASEYGTEEIVGAAVKGRRSQVIISTKCRPVHPGDRYAEAELVSPAEFARSVDGCLARLGTDYIDILYIHGVLPGQYAHCRDELVPVLEDLKRAGKIRFAGISERFTSDTVHSMLEVALADDRFDVLMLGLNVLNQTALRRVLPAASRQGVGVQAIYALRGKLADHAAVRELVREAVAHGEVDPAEVDLDDPLGFLVAPDVAESVIDACYRFDGHAAGVTSVVTGTGRLEHLRQNLRSISQPALPPHIIERLHQVFGRVESVTGD